jgi:hypothetical protein
LSTIPTNHIIGSIPDHILSITASGVNISVKTSNSDDNIQLATEDDKKT